MIVLPQTASSAETYQSIADYKGGLRADELTFSAGESIEVVEKQGGWWRGKRTRSGWFPAECVSATRISPLAGEVIEPVAGVVFCPFDDWLT